MSRSFCLAIALCALIAAALAQQNSLRADSNSAVADEIRKLDLELDQQIVHSQWDEYAAHLADDFVGIGRDGALRSRDEILSQLRSGQIKFLDLQPEHTNVRVYGDTAVLTGNRTDIFRQSGRVLTHAGRYTAVFIHRDSRWWLVSLQMTAASL